MKKQYVKLSALALSLVMLLSLAACNNAAPEEPVVSPPDLTPTPGALVEPPVEIPEYALDPVAVRDITALAPVFHSLMLGLRETSGDSPVYDVNEALFWNTLYLLSVNYGVSDPRNTLLGDTLSVPVNVMQEYASSCFGDYGGLYDIPADNPGVTFNESNGVYAFSMSDVGDNYAKIIDIAENGAGGYDVMVAWLGHGEEYPDMLSAYLFIVSPNGLVAELGDPGAIYKYSVMYAMPTSTDYALVLDTYERDGRRYALVDTVFLQMHNADDLDERGQPYGYDGEHILNPDEDEIELLISDYAEFDMDIGNLFDDIDPDAALEDNVQFFMDNAGRAFEEQHLLFEINRYDGILYSGRFYDEYYTFG
ncbi:MAG: hypothetical protein LBS18_08565 [Clostridiales bacterium]|jgi:hypothetical protein|nr:hypothetical protein [Clostridiales bacterium]